MSINLAIRNRRSVFSSQFDNNRRIPDEIILEILHNANAAPSHKLTEPWRFTVFTGNGLEKLGQQQAEIYKANAGEKFKENKYLNLQTAPRLCSHIIAIGCKRSIGVIPEMEEVAAVSCAVQNIYLSLDAYGIGGYWSTGGITFMEDAKKLVGLEPHDVFMGFFYLGYVQVPSVHRTPTSLESKVTWITG
ncbi:MAG: nitroreductase [Chitinophagaceae bacterium]|nr:MAG: nitroreductase [Chitinophagaceae bacterium]